MNQPTTPNTVNSIAGNADAMIILTQGYPADAVARVVDAHTARVVQAAILADRAQRPTVAGSIGDYTGFCSLLDTYGQALVECESAGYYRETIDRKESALTALVAYINARLAPAAPSGALEPSSAEEVAAFEAWASAAKYDMSTHPLHWLFLNERTYAARQGWKAALAFARDSVATHPTPSSPTAPTDGDAIAKSKHIMALIDRYCEAQNVSNQAASHARLAIRCALMAEFEGLPAQAVPEGGEA